MGNTINTVRANRREIPWHAYSAAVNNSVTRATHDKFTEIIDILRTDEPTLGWAYRFGGSPCVDIIIRERMVMIIAFARKGLEIFTADHIFVRIIEYADPKLFDTLHDTIKNWKSMDTIDGPIV